MVSLSGNAVLYPSTTEGATSSGGSLTRIRSEFPVAPDPSVWDVVTGTGATITAGQTAQGTVLAIAGGTTANAVTSLTSTQVFTAPFRIAVSAQLSAKIVNQTVYIEAVALNADGTTDETRVVAWALTGNDNVTATNASIEAQNGGAARVRLTNQVVPSYVGAIGATAPAQTFEIEHLNDEVWFHGAASDSTAGRANSYRRSTTVADPNRLYKVRLRIVNGATAPVAATAYFGHVSVDDHTDTPVEIVGARGNGQAASSLPVTVASGTVSLAASQVVGQSASATAGTPPSTLRIDALLATPVAVKATAGRLYWATIYNPNAAMAAVHFYNAVTGSTTPGTTTPGYTIPVPAGATIHVDCGGMPLANFATAITVAATTTATIAGAVAPTTALSVTVGWL